ncbi:MAG: LysR family transcriptional regulator [Rhodospirillales bacterium]|nr:LysR family transcriptional regulator [Rhodospirillales bacterium]
MPGDLDAFLRVAQTSSFRESAEILGISQPSVSSRIQHLEAVLGVKLFERTTRRVTITDAGERLRGRVERMVIDMRSLVREFKDESHLKRGRVRLGASPSVAASFLPRVISEYQRLWPLIEVELIDDFFGQVLDRIDKGEVDLAVTPFVPGEASFTCEPLFNDVFMLAVPDSHRLAMQESVVIADLAGEKLLSMPPESAAWAVIRRAFASVDADYAPTFLTRDSVTIVSLIKVGVGISLVSGLIASVLDMWGIKLLPVRDADLTRSIGIVRARDRTPTSAVEALCKLLRHFASEFKHPQFQPKRRGEPTEPSAISCRPSWAWH